MEIVDSINTRSTLINLSIRHLSPHGFDFVLSNDRKISLIIGQNITSYKAIHLKEEEAIKESGRPLPGIDSPRQ